MDMIEHFTRLFAYDEWANQEALAGLRAAPTPVLVPEIVSSYFRRGAAVDGTAPTEAADASGLAGVHHRRMRRASAELPALWKNYLASRNEADLAHPAKYQNSKGETWSSRKDDILMHLITHSAYHRGR